MASSKWTGIIRTIVVTTLTFVACGPPPGRLKLDAPFGPDTWQIRRLVKEATGNLTDGDTVFRVTTGDHSQPVVPRVQTKARNYKMHGLGDIIAFGAMLFPAHGFDDSTYKVGGLNVDEKDVERRTLVFVAYRPYGYPIVVHNPIPPDDTIEGRWKLYRMEPDPFGVPYAKEVKAGAVRRCGEPSEPNEGKDAYTTFITCDGARAFHELEMRYAHHGLRFKDFSKLSTTMVARSNGRLPFAAALDAALGGPTGTTGLVQFDTLPLVDRRAIVERIKKSRLDSRFDPYWFTCGQGCCTAGDFET